MLRAGLLVAFVAACSAFAQSEPRHGPSCRRGLRPRQKNSGYGLISLIYEFPASSNARNKNGFSYPRSLDLFLWWHLSVMGFDRVHLVVFYNESKVPPTVQDVYGDASCETTWAQHKRLSWEPVPFRPINASVPLDGKPRDFDPNYKAPAITKAYNALRSRYDWIAILDNDELVFRNGTGALDDGCPADAPIVAGLRTSLGDAYDHITSACLAPFVFLQRRGRLPVQRSPERDAYRGQTEPPPPGDKGQRSCFKSLHRTAGPQRLGGKFSMHIGNGPHVQITPARPGALAVSHIRGKSLWWHPSAAVNATTARDNVFFDEVRRRAACSSLSRDARDASGRPGEK